MIEDVLVVVKSFDFLDITANLREKDMREAFRIQPKLHSIPVEEIEIPAGSRHPLYAIMRALQWLYPHSRELTKKIVSDVSGGKRTSRGAPGMSGWQALVLAVVRMSRDLTFEDVEMEFNENRLLRQFLELDADDTTRFSSKTLQQNFARISDETLNEILVWFMKIMEKFGVENAQIVRGDSFVCGRPIHYPTDQSVVMDGAMKVAHLCREAVGPKSGWRQSEHLCRKVKRLCREIGQLKRGRGSDRKEIKVAAAYRELVKAAQGIVEKALDTIEADLIPKDALGKVVHYLMLLDQGIELVIRRTQKGEAIPNREKLHSIFEHETELINRGKFPVAIEFGHRVYVAQGKSGLIVDWRIMENGGTDAAEFEKLLARLRERYGKIRALSLDKGFWVKNAHEIAKGAVELLVMAKKGGRDAATREREREPEFVELRHWRSGVESLISSMVRCNGLKRCQDRGMPAFRRWVLAAILTRNLLTLGRLIEEGRIRTAA
jgi:hypothetical protein